MTEGPIVAQVLEGENAIAKNREIMGATNPKEAAAGTIRADFGTDIERNAVHGSDAAETAARDSRSSSRAPSSTARAAAADAGLRSGARRRRLGAGSRSEAVASSRDISSAPTLFFVGARDSKHDLGRRGNHRVAPLVFVAQPWVREPQFSL